MIDKGTYNISIKPKYYLAKKLNNLTIEFSSVSFGSSYGGDFNNDNVVNSNDIGPFSGCYGQNVTLNPDCERCDLSGNGKVDSSDIASFSYNYGKDGASL